MAKFDSLLNGIRINSFKERTDGFLSDDYGCIGRNVSHDEMPPRFQPTHHLFHHFLLLWDVIRHTSHYYQVHWLWWSRVLFQESIEDIPL